jgi:hypothetical protein
MTRNICSNLLSLLTSLNDLNFFFFFKLFIFFFIYLWLCAYLRKFFMGSDIMLLKDIIAIFLTKVKYKKKMGAIRRELAHAEAMDSCPTKYVISAKFKPLPLHKYGSQWGRSCSNGWISRNSLGDFGRSFLDLLVLGWVTALRLVFGMMCGVGSFSLRKVFQSCSTLLA